MQVSQVASRTKSSGFELGWQIKDLMIVLEACCEPQWLDPEIAVQVVQLR